MLDIMTGPYTATHARLAAPDKNWLPDHDSMMVEAEGLQGAVVSSLAH